MTSPTPAIELNDLDPSNVSQYTSDLMLSLVKLTVLCRDYYNITPVTSALAAARANRNIIHWNDSNLIYLTLRQVKAFCISNEITSPALLDKVIAILRSIVASPRSRPQKSRVIINIASNPTGWYTLS